MKYRIWDLSYKADLKILLNSITGKAKVYFYNCASMRSCPIINKDFITANQNSFISGNYTTSVLGVELDIPNEINDCHKNNPNGLQFRCIPVILVLCEGDVECSYKITLTSNEDHILLTEK